MKLQRRLSAQPRLPRPQAMGPNSQGPRMVSSTASSLPALQGNRKGPDRPGGVCGCYAAASRSLDAAAGRFGGWRGSRLHRARLVGSAAVGNAVASE